MHDALVHDVGHQLGRGLLDRLLDRVDDLRDRRLERLADLVAGHLDAARQAGQQVAAAEGHRPLLRSRVGRSDRDLDLLGGPLAHQQVVLAPREADDVGVHLVAADADAAATTIPPRLMTATSVVPPPMSTMSEPDGSLTGRPAPMAAAIGSSMSRDQRAPALMVASRTARFSTSVTPDGMPTRTRGRAHLGEAIVDLGDEVPNHLLGHVEVADHPVAQRADGDDVGRRAADHPLRLGADGQDALRPRVHGDHRWLADDDAAVADGDERVRGAEVDPDVVAEEAEQAVEESQGPSRECGARPGRGTSVRARMV